MFCYHKEISNKSIEEDKILTTKQLLLEFYNNLYELCLQDFINMMFVKMIKQFIDFALSIGISRLEDLKINIDTLLMDFFNQTEFIDKIEEAGDNRSKRNKCISFI